jgi:Lon protease-like protein
VGGFVPPLDRYRKSTDLPLEIPVFPLRGVILLPRATLPLNIFEPRYLEMLDDVLSGARLLGVIQPDRTDDVAEESPRERAVPLKRVGCTGRVTAYQELDDGRLLITLTGIARFNVVSETETTKPYRLCRVDYTKFAGDLDLDDSSNDVDRPELLRVLKSYLEAHKLRADWKAITNAETEMLINALSVVSPFGAEEKQALLEAPDICARADVLVALAEMELASSEGGGSTLQ